MIVHNPPAGHVTESRTNRGRSMMCLRMSVFLVSHHGREYERCRSQEASILTRYATIREKTPKPRMAISGRYAIFPESSPIGGTVFCSKPRMYSATISPPEDQRDMICIQSFDLTMAPSSLRSCSLLHLRSDGEQVLSEERGL